MNVWAFGGLTSDVYYPDFWETVPANTAYGATKLNWISYPHEHTFGEWVTVKDATCTEDGQRQRTCSVCDLVETEVIPVIEHTVVVDPAVAPTCTDAGKTEGSHCSVCGEIIKAQETVPATGHSFGDWVITKEATTTEEGEMQRTCSICGAVETKSIEKLPAVAVPEFTDVPAGEWYAKSVNWAVENQITAGTSDTTFSPKDTCTRAQIVQLLYNQVKKPAVELTTRFSDVPSDKWYTKAVAWAVSKNITSGLDDTHFGPEDSCTRAQVVQFLYNAAGRPSVTKTEKFTDVPSGTWYSDAVAWAVANKITVGTSDTTFGPEDTCTRAHIVQFLYNQEFNR